MLRLPREILRLHRPGRNSIHFTLTQMFSLVSFVFPIAPHKRCRGKNAEEVALKVQTTRIQLQRFPHVGSQEFRDRVSCADRDFYGEELLQGSSAADRGWVTIGSPCFTCICSFFLRNKDLEKVGSNRLEATFLSMTLAASYVLGLIEYVSRHNETIRIST